MTRLCVPAALLPILLLSVPLRAETPQKHIRVIVDTTGSLHTTDPSGYVKLSTELLYDLADKEFYQKDTFKIVRFPDHGDPAWPRPSPGKMQLPETIDEKKYMTEPARNAAGATAFHAKVGSFSYTSDWTYFAPGIQWALNDLLKEAPGSNRVIVLITDGKSDDQDQDQARLRGMIRALHDNHIQVFVLPFGDADPSWFRSALDLGDPAGVSGDVFGRSDSRELLSNMVKIFLRSFGFSMSEVNPEANTIDISGGFTPQKAAVIAMFGRPDTQKFRLTSPDGQMLDSSHVEAEAAKPDSKRKAEPTPVSYALEWVDTPARGLYHLDANGARPSQIAVLRPVRLQSAIRSLQGNPTDVVMAGKQAPMEVLVSQSDGSVGDPGDNVHVKFHLRYFRPGNDNSDTNDYYPQPPGGEKTPEGRVFKIYPEFIEKPKGAPVNEDPGGTYQGYIDIEVMQFDSTVATMRDPHPVTVYPYLDVGVDPPSAVVHASSGNERIEGGQAGCASEIKFVDYSQGLTADHYTLSVRLLNAPESSGAWSGAKFRFDGMEFSGTGAATETVSPGDLKTPKHSFCVIAGTPSSEDLNKQLQVHFGLWRNGADANEQKLNIVKDLPVGVSIAAPDFWHTLKPWLLLLLTALLMYLLMLLLRSKYILAPDLGVALGASGGSLAAIGARAEGFGWGLFGLPQDMPVLSLDGGREVGRVKPKRDGLYVFRPGPGFENVARQSNDAWGEWTPVDPDMDGTFRLAAGVTYRAGSGDAHLFRIEYAQKRPGL